MQLLTIVTALLLPLGAVANPPGVASDEYTTTTLTSYVTLTQTVTLERAAIETVTAKNGTATFTTGAPSSKVTTTAASALPTGGAAALGSSNVALVAIAGVVVAAFL
ncbi:hypothetical protein B0T16DRAFT_383930 [Cercophora newfieldiana]|uniref:Uncharacterized protein n=1 Tax=Cercophora newfieldiana TaxID=92897 RepID=A0AA39YN53_9PEZI|nr:hypothetical protein B0T16DRAFT_383930 [Cercophora newfieldiana]